MGAAALAALGLLVAAAPHDLSGPAAAGGPLRAPGVHVTGPPTAHTGGFGEPTCRACHFDYDLNEPGGSLDVRGLPTSVGAGAPPVELAVVLVRPGMGRAGVELSVRYAAGPRTGEQAGHLELAGERLELAAEVTDAGEIVYARHTETGTGLSAPDTARWHLRWAPPDAPAGPVVVHVAANAANDDFSEFGDRIYVDSVVVRGPGSR